MEYSIIDGRYQLLNEIGSGGEAHVFSARDEETGNEVAVRLAERFIAIETAIAPATSHDGWVQLLASGTDPTYGTFQVFELLEGQTLRERISAGPLAPDEWRAFVDQSLDSVEALHLCDWVHGDINADNFFTTASRWKLLELPFYCFEPPAGRSAMFGSIYTLAPEQIDGARPSVLSDIYSLGCLYYYAASGTWPHSGSTEQEVAISCLIHAPVSLRQVAPELPESWSDWVMKLIAPKPASRCPSIAAARQLLADEVA